MAEAKIQQIAREVPVAAPSLPGDLGILLTGGGARGAYQVGVLRWLARRFPDLRIPVLTGVSAGAVNAAYLASHHGTFQQAVSELCTIWTHLTTEHVFRVDVWSLGSNVLRWVLRLVVGGVVPAPRVRSFLDTAPLRELLEEVFVTVNGEFTGIDYNLGRDVLRAVAVMTTSYTTGQSVTWVQGRDVQLWTRPQRRSVLTRLCVDHVMASAALPLFFPAVRMDGAWYGDGGIRLVAPLSPALHLGASRILAISTRHERTQAQADRPAIVGYPPPAQMFGVLMNSVFLDVIDQDALLTERLNRLVLKLPPEERNGLRPVGLLVLRPSRDLGRMARAYEPWLPWTFRMLTRGLGTRETRSSDLLSMVMFQPEYLRRLVELGEADAEAQAAELEAFITGTAVPGEEIPAAIS